MNDNIRQMKKNCEAEIMTAAYKINESYGGRLFTTDVFGTSGRGMFAGLFWWMVKINPEMLKDKYARCGYDALQFVPYRVGRDAVGELFDDKLFVKRPTACATEYYGKYWGRTDEDELPHIDSTTGNIHIAFDHDKWDGTIKQLIIAQKVTNDHYGPQVNPGFTDMFDESELILYRRRSESLEESVCVPRDCHYPRIMSERGDESLEVMLENMLGRILK